MLRFFNPRSSEQSDEDLLARYQAGGELAVLGQLFERYAELVYGVCLKYCRDEQEAEDAAMAVFEQLVAKAREHEVHNFKSWLHVLTKNHCLMQLRKASRAREQSFEPQLMQSVDSRHHTIEIHEDNGQLKGLNDCMEQLPEEQRQCVQAFYLEGHSYKEIAGFRKEELGRVRSYIQNGRRNLRICLEKKGVKV
ncbi:MAG: sigma-70 family RNA polymerase sigma factor [Lewinellaceae bacterium]|nr:sigma-70 family RNA polymerase sigma factor [Phaeodactylibacter sp.]MCB9042036.1 sigma-70 family RNA polymerase sigma factor [Lewinellaceae bacterium]